ncbi:cobyrinate a,c-diamide synthase [Candidatus Nitrososphaera sp. FF02]|uniref:cobyrinate a,c-diamide synthase n=1 Tax=Candidatus Nitrososphaera sp. FF02 TaxID=3398226 RepID=UPI0039EA8594
MTVPRIVVAGVTSGVGKTTVAVALMHALRKKGMAVQPFKVGPDFIDPSYHTFVTKRKSRNLDVWLMGRHGVIDCFVSACEGADIAVVEGVMGLFDGMSGRDNFASTAHVARMLGAPVLLVVDASKSARSIAAIALGFARFDRSIRIAGIILNNVASDRHAGYITEALAGRVRAPVVGIIKRNSEIRMEERHLGLVPAQELQAKKRRAVFGAAKFVAEQLDVDRIIGMCARGPLAKSRAEHRPQKARTTIAVALDESFNFYYADNIDALRSAGARLVFFSPVNDDRLPEGAGGVILGGGFPEVLADRLEENRAMMKQVAKVAGAGMPLYGECGGLMYLTRSIKGYRGEKKAHMMAGVIDADTLMTSRLTLNYTEADCAGPLFGRANLHGHEFHYSAIENIARDSRFAYDMKKGKGITGGKDGFVLGQNGLAAYMHLHFANGRLAQRLVDACASYSRR